MIPSVLRGFLSLLYDLRVTLNHVCSYTENKRTVLQMCRIPTVKLYHIWSSLFDGHWLPIVLKTDDDSFYTSGPTVYVETSCLEVGREATSRVQ